MLHETIGFIGAGQMARALAGGMVEAGLVSGSQIFASDTAPEALREFGELVSGARTTADNTKVAAEVQILFLAIKPQQMAAVTSELRSAVTKNHLVISIAAGVRLATLDEALGGHGRLIRVMPNTPCLIREGACGYSLGPRATEADGQLVGKLLGAVGRAILLDEKLLDAVTGLSGSGPAFVCVLIEALADGGVRMGLPREVALELAAQTAKGTADMVLTTGHHPAVLKDRVASPGGTTIAGLKALEEGGFRAAAIAAVEAATKRSIELAGN
jgi:pyrroline-5-carboxylate reductase